MPQTIHRGIKSLIDEANAEIETVSAADAIKAAQEPRRRDRRYPRPPRDRARRQDPRRVLLHPRHAGILDRSGKAPTPSRSSRRTRNSSSTAPAALRSALAAKTAQDMGLKPVAHMGGGFAAWRDAGGPVEKWEPKKKG